VAEAGGLFGNPDERGTSAVDICYHSTGEETTDIILCAV
jgi:hypothetical protein